MTEKDIQQKIDDAMVEVYKLILNPLSTAKDIQNIFWVLVENMRRDTYSYVEKKITDIKLKRMLPSQLLYDGLDNDRIEKYFNDFVENKRKSKNTLLNQLSVIFNTEGFMVHNNVFIKAAEFIETKLDDPRKQVKVLIYASDDSECGIHSGEYYWREASAYCQHPNCKCTIEDIYVSEEEAIKMVEDGYNPDLDPNE